MDCDLKGIGAQSLLLQASSESTAKAWLDEGGCKLARILFETSAQICSDYLGGMLQAF